MKILKLCIIITSLICIRYSSANTILIQQSNFAFTPDTVSAAVGDTIKWVWNVYIHTTTSTSIPAGAAPWSAPLDSAHTTFLYRITAAGQYHYQCNYHYLMGMTGLINVNPTGVIPISTNAPENFSLYQNYPNPFNPSTNIKFDIPVRAGVLLRIYDVSGRIVAELVNEKLQAGTYSVDWNASNNASGVYFYRLETSEFTITKKLAVIK